MKLSQILVLVFLFVLAFIPRLYKIDNPIADWHSWRQSDTAAVARDMAQNGINLLYPKAHNYLPMNGLPNPERYFLNEFPVYNAIVAILYKMFGINTIYARLVSVFFASLATVFLYLLTKKLINARVGFLAAVLFAILPFNIYYGRVVMPDPMHICFSIASLYFLSLWVYKQKISYAILTGLAWAVAMLTKPYAIVLLLPASYLVIRAFRLKAFKKPGLYIILALGLIPLALWRLHINQHPEGMFGSGWLINQGDIRFTGAFFRWLIFERMNRLIFATGGFVLFFFGLVSNRIKKEGWFFEFWLLAVIIYMTYFARGNVTHDYYQLPLVPVGCVLMAKGVDFLLKNGVGFMGKMINWFVALVLVLLMLAFGWYETRGFFNINHPEIIEAGQAVDQLTPKDARVIAPYQKDPAFLYQTQRNGWTDFDVVETMWQWIKQDGADYLVSVNYDDQTNYWLDRCQTLIRNEKFVIIDLQTCQEEQASPDDSSTLDVISM
ncbi:glycosyltransferase family 39 protein [Candidatus Beckwithbacteria bacterium]|nr:glycosyltransferase family 39 protein [Candidatus Beckwithbacteria bacterium]